MEKPFINICDLAEQQQATSETLASEDWGLNVEICDLINESEDGPRDAIKAIRKRLTSQPKNYTVVMYSLTVLETCVKNCGKRFHIVACSKDFVQELLLNSLVLRTSPQLQSKRKSYLSSKRGPMHSVTNLSFQELVRYMQI
ncbi:target of Myb1 membrane trafficking protein-like [Macrobrachium nipponense]|uniref:target of Myb1 membrane trafficking protein-like n=1 Tax=Macrobrachium nipponense TaxID=159736 RepID=UPI0030C7B8A0